MELTPFRNLPKTEKISHYTDSADLSLKYKPDKIDDFVGNKSELETTKSWILHDNSQEKMAIMYAPPGVGKSLLLELIQKTYSDTMNIVITKDKSMDEINSILKGEHQPTILEVFNDVSAKKNKLILIDDIDLKIQSEKDQP